MMEVVSEGVVDIGGKAGLVDAFFFVDDGGGFVEAVASVSSFSALLVGLPLLLL